MFVNHQERSTFVAPASSKDLRQAVKAIFL